MTNCFVIFGLVILSAATLHASTYADVLAEYRRRGDIVTKLVSLYEKYEEGRDTPANETLKESYVTYFNENFDDTSDWIVNAFTFEPPIPIIMQAIVKESKTDYNKVKEFGDGAEETLRSAYSMKEKYIEVNGTESEEDVDIEVDEITKRTSIATVQSTITKTLAYIKDTAWKSQYTSDIDVLVNKFGISHILSQNIFSFLSKKYFYRNWFTAIYKTTTPSRICENTNASSYMRETDGFTIRVFQADPNRPNLKAFAQTTLNNIPDRISSYWTCKIRISEIVTESKYTCGSNILPLFSVFAGESPMLGFNKDQIVYKFVVRRRWFKKCDPSTYPIIIFA